MTEIKDKRLKIIEKIIDDMIEKEKSFFGGDIVASKIAIAKIALRFLDLDFAYRWRFFYLLSKIFEKKSDFYIETLEKEMIQKVYE